MRTLYLRIVVTFVLLSLTSGALALLAANAYYNENIRGYSERKIEEIGREIRALYELRPGVGLGDYLTHIAALGFQIYSVDERMQGVFYGTPFKHKQIDDELIRRVLSGDAYNGMAEERHLLNVLGLFESSIRNSVGLPVRAEGRTYAVFIRPNLEQQFGEVRMLLAVLLGFGFLFNLVLIVISTRYIVKPVKKLTAATDQIVRGDYDIALEVARRDEIGDLARHFGHMARSLKQLDEMRQEFVANVSHEIQSPLTSIQGFSRTMLDGEVPAEERERYLRIIEEESGRLSSLGKQLLTLASLDKEQHVLKPSVYRLDEQLRQVLIVTEWQWADKRLTIEPDFPAIVIRADAGLLHQVWLNLITNAVKFSEPGGKIRISIVEAERDIAVTIEDSGIGIPSDELDRIFERFYKADKARNRSRSGSGLGLSIVKKIVDLHGGTVGVDSRPGKGAAFTVRLPRHL